MRLYQGEWDPRCKCPMRHETPASNEILDTSIQRELRCQNPMGSEMPVSNEIWDTSILWDLRGQYPMRSEMPVSNGVLESSIQWDRVSHRHTSNQPSQTWWVTCHVTWPLLWSHLLSVWDTSVQPPTSSSFRWIVNDWSLTGNDLSLIGNDWSLIGNDWSLIGND